MVKFMPYLWTSIMISHLCEEILYWNLTLLLICISSRIVLGFILVAVFMLQSLCDNKTLALRLKHILAVLSLFVPPVVYVGFKFGLSQEG